jgi:hypothetical protein
MEQGCLCFAARIRMKSWNFSKHRLKIEKVNMSKIKLSIEQFQIRRKLVTRDKQPLLKMSNMFVIVEVLSRNFPFADVLICCCLQWAHISCS